MKNIFYKRIGIIFIFIIAFLPALPGVASETSSCPEIYLDLNGVTISQINAGSKEIRYLENTLYIRENRWQDSSEDASGEHSENDLQNDLEDIPSNVFETRIDQVEIKGRGNSTWAFTRKNFSSNRSRSKGKKGITKKIQVKKSSITSKKIRRPSGYQPLYLRVRVYKTIGKKKYYSLWSKVKKIKGN